MSWPPFPDTATICEVDQTTGRVTRIPGVYPWREVWARWRPTVLVLIGCGLFLLIGFLQEA